METFVSELAERVGIDQATAEKVVEFVKENIHRLPELLGSASGPSSTGGGLLDSITGQLGGLLDGK